jgi:hypothetical protein
MPMPDEMTPEEAVNRILEEAIKMLKKDGHYAPILFVYGREGDAVALVDFRDEDSKHRAFLMAGVAAARLQPYLVAFVDEAWMSRTIPPKGKAVSNMPDRQDCLIAAAQDERGRMHCVLTPISRAGGTVQLGEPLRSDNAQLSLLDLFWEGVKLGRAMQEGGGG